MQGQSQRTKEREQKYIKKKLAEFHDQFSLLIIKSLQITKRFQSLQSINFDVVIIVKRGRGDYLIRLICLIRQTENRSYLFCSRIKVPCRKVKLLARDRKISRLAT